MQQRICQQRVEWIINVNSGMSAYAENPNLVLSCQLVLDTRQYRLRTCSFVGLA
jgi:hypothetical protein